MRSTTYVATIALVLCAIPAALFATGAAKVERHVYDNYCEADEAGQMIPPEDHMCIGVLTDTKEILAARLYLIDPLGNQHAIWDEPLRDAARVKRIRRMQEESSHQRWVRVRGGCGFGYDDRYTDAGAIKHHIAELEGRCKSAAPTPPA